MQKKCRCPLPQGSEAVHQRRSEGIEALCRRRATGHRLDARPLDCPNLQTPKPPDIRRKLGSMGRGGGWPSRPSQYAGWYFRVSVSVRRVEVSSLHVPPVVLEGQGGGVKDWRGRDPTHDTTATVSLVRTALSTCIRGPRQWQRTAGHAVRPGTPHHAPGDVRCAGGGGGGIRTPTAPPPPHLRLPKDVSEERRGGGLGPKSVCTKSAQTRYSQR